MARYLNSLVVLNQCPKLFRSSYYLTCLQLHKSLYTVDKEWEYLEVVNKSKFFVKLTNINDMDNAMLFLKRISDSKASHNCWAFRLLDGYERCSDDGEPSGTAGRPILTAISSNNMVDVMIVITRYFGGIKLGTGGLTRAYGNAAKSCIEIADKIEIQPKIKIQCVVKMPLVASVYSVLKSFPEVKKLSESYEDDRVIIMLHVPDSDSEEFRKKLHNISKGQVIFNIYPS